MTIAVVIPALNEEGNIGRLIAETFAAVPGEILGEVIVVDDGSTDGTAREIKALLPRYGKLKYLRHEARSGQSSAVRTGVSRATSPYIVTMDGDGQNDPADIFPLYRAIESHDSAVALVGGVRTRRKAKGSRRLASVIANKIRNAVLKDNCPDSGCGIKIFRREEYLALPFFTSMHRFMPALFLIYGHQVAYHPVNDRPRLAGQSKYTNFNRALLGIFDMVGIVWLRRRTRVPRIIEEAGGAEAESASSLEAGGAPAQMAARGSTA